MKKHSNYATNLLFLLYLLPPYFAKTVTLFPVNVASISKKMYLKKRIKETHHIASDVVEGQSNYHIVQDHQFSSFQMYDYFLTFCNKVHCAIHKVNG